MTRVLGQNPGPYTLQGTNTYLIGAKGHSAILLDTGEDKQVYNPLLRKALTEVYTGVSDIILSHYHHDHTMGLKSVLLLLDELSFGKPNVHKITSEEEPELDKPTFDILASLKDKFEPAPSGPIHALQGGQTFSVTGGATLKVLATPGHTEDSASFLLQGNNEETVLFTADTVLGQGTAVFTDLKALISSLEKCIAEVEKAAGKDAKVKLFCGHGPVAEDGVAKMKEYIAHRLQREKQVLEALSKADKPITAKE